MHALARPAPLTAQQLFKARHAHRMRWSAVIALALLALLVWQLPTFQPTPYRLQTDALRAVEIDMEAAVLPPPPPREVPRPRGPVVAAPPEDPAIVEYPDIEKLFLPIPQTGWQAPAAEAAPFQALSEKPRLLQGAQAHYPEMARLAGLQGTVVVVVTVGPAGRVIETAVLKGVHSLLDRPALAAARKLVFSPGTQRGIPVKCQVAVPFRFFLQ